MKSTRTIVFASLFVVLEIVFSRYLVLEVPTMKFSFTFVVMAICGYMMGWKIGALVALLADLIGMVIYPPNAPFFIGFTLIAMFAGALHGMLYQKEGKDLTRSIIFVCVVNALITHALLNSLSLVYITNLNLSVFIIPRLIKAVVEIPLTIGVLIFVMKQVVSQKKLFKL